MPAFIGGPVTINSIDSGVVNFGDAYNLSPKATSKINAGSGSFNTGQFINTNSGVSNTITRDPDVIDQTQTANA